MNNPLKETAEAPLPKNIGPYEVLKKIGHGGMGEVFLAKDPALDRNVAIKRIKPELASHDLIRKRFLREVKVTAALSHPSIIPVYSVHESESELYYVMPFVDGTTLKNILRETLHKEKSGETHAPISVSLKNLMNIFLNVCHAIAYCHSKGILHRDLKPENILVGSFGQSLIVDWGLAGSMEEKELSLPFQIEIPEGLTNPGKVMGTLPYMPPERVEGKPADAHTDIYSLGVILYQLLTLKMPFHRPSIRQYKKTKKFETLVDALEVTPYRDVPHQLSNIAKKCLAKEARNRYSSVEDLITDIDRYNAGRPDWIFSAELNIDNKKDWQLQENVLISKLIAITRSTEIMQWYVLMISKTSFSGNKRLEARLTFSSKETEGVGFLINIPSAKEKVGIEDGYCIWIGSEKNPGIKLYRSQVVILEIADKFIPAGEEVYIEIEKSDQNVQVYINKNLIINYQDSLPIVGTHVGLLVQDMDFELNNFKVFTGSPNAMVNCLSIPDAFLTSKNFDEAIHEYKKISKSFSGRSEGREALFRMGIALIEKAKFEAKASEQNYLFDSALETFELLHATSSEPLEYLGKSLVYNKQNDLNEELKCLELGVRKFKNHPLIQNLEERVLFRLHESAKRDRVAVYEFALLTLNHLTSLLSNRETHSLIHTLILHAEKPLFMHDVKKVSKLDEIYRHMAIQLAFWLNKKGILLELLEKESSPILKENIEFSLAFLGHRSCPMPSAEKLEESIANLFFYLYSLVDRKNAAKLLETLEKTAFLYPSHEKELDVFFITAYLFLNHFEKAFLLLEKYPRDREEKPFSPFYFLYGCYLAKTSGLQSAEKHFHAMTDYTYPPIHSIFGYSMKTSPELFTKWEKESLQWEKIELLKGQILFFHCIGKKSKVLFYENKLKKTGIYSKTEAHD
jgi:serine/threonine protein kinase